MCLKGTQDRPSELIVVPVPQITEEIAAAIQPVPQGSEQDAEQIVHIPVSQIKEVRIVRVPIHDMQHLLQRSQTWHQLSVSPSQRQLVCHAKLQCTNTRFWHPPLRKLKSRVPSSLCVTGTTDHVPWRRSSKQPCYEREGTSPSSSSSSSLLLSSPLPPSRQLCSQRSSWPGGRAK